MHSFIFGSMLVTVVLLSPYPLLGENDVWSSLDSAASSLSGKSAIQKTELVAPLAATLQESDNRNIHLSTAHSNILTAAYLLQHQLADNPQQVLKSRFRRLDGATSLIESTQTAFMNQLWEIFFRASYMWWSPISESDLLVGYYNPYVDAALLATWVMSDDERPSISQCAFISGNTLKKEVLDQLPGWIHSALPLPLSLTRRYDAIYAAFRSLPGSGALYDSVMMNDDSEIIEDRLMASALCFRSIIENPAAVASISSHMKAMGMELRLADNKSDEITMPKLTLSRPSATIAYVASGTRHIHVLLQISGNPPSVMALALDGDSFKIQRSVRAPIAERAYREQ